MYGKSLPNASDEKDLGVTIYRDLKFKTHISEKVKKANTTAGIIRRSFKYLDADMYRRLFTSVVRPILEYGQNTWSPHKTQINEIENVQRRSSKQLPGMKEKSYTERLTEIDLPCLLTRRIRGDLIETYKLLHEKYDAEVSGELFRLNRNTNTRNNGWKIAKQGSRINCRRYFYTLRTVNIWNRLDAATVNASSLYGFKQKIDGFLKAKEIYYDFEKCLKFFGENA